MNLGNVANILMGQSPKGDSYNNTGEGIPLLNGPTEFGPSYPVLALWTTRPTKLCKSGDLLFCVRGSTGRMNWADQTYCLGRGVAGIHAKSESSIDTKFIYYQVVNQLPALLAIATGSVFTNLSSKDFAKFEIDWPDPKQREDIASILGTLDDKIELNRRTNETLESMARALFKDWFVDFGPTRAKAEGQAPYLAPELWELFPDVLDDDDKPVGWMNSRLGDFVELVYGKALKADVRKPGSIPVYGSNGQVGWHNVNLADGPGVVVGRKGNPGTANYVIEDFFCIDTTFYAKPKSPHWTYPFLWLLMEQLNLPGLAADSAVPGLNREIAYSAECVASKSEVAVAFSETVEPLLTRIAHNKKESETLAQLRDLLLPKLMSGEIRLHDAEKAVEVVL